MRTWTSRAIGDYLADRQDDVEFLAPPGDTHFNGQSTVVLDGARATGESYTIAHHLFTADGERKIMIASLRYLDTFVKTGDSWFFAERNLILDWSETRPSAP